MKSRNMPKLIIAVILLITASCSKIEEDVPLYKPAVKLDFKEMVRKASLVNQEIPFTAVNDKGEVVEDAKFFVNGEEWTEGVFKSDKVGDFKLKVVYKGKDGEDVEKEADFKVVVPGRNVVVEDYTGAWCKYCPAANLAVEGAKEKTKNVVPIAIHVPGTGLKDNIVFSKVEDLAKELKVDIKGVPRANINRTQNWKFKKTPEKTDYTPILSLAGQPVNIGIGIATLLEDNVLKTQVSVAYGADLYEEGDRLVVYLLEDKIKHDQINAFNTESGHPLEGKGNPIKGYNNNDVLRESFTNVTGNDLENITPLVEFKANFEETLTIGDTPGPEYNNYNKDNLLVAAIVVDKDNNAKQAQYVHVKAGGESYVYYDGSKSEDAEK